jgi:hypothetical protein
MHLKLWLFIAMLSQDWKQILSMATIKTRVKDVLRRLLQQCLRVGQAANNSRPEVARPGDRVMR